MKFDGKTIVITGAGSGLGQATAVKFAEQGANVVVTDINEELGQSTVDLITQHNGSAIFCKVDVRNEDDIKKMIDVAVETYGKLDFAFNNAGIGGTTEGRGIKPHEIATKDWKNIIDINLTGVFLCMKYEVAQFLKQETGGVIVNMSSVAGLRGTDRPGYSGSKHGVMGITKAFAREYAKQNIRVTAVNPAFIETPIIAKAGMDLDNPQHRGYLENIQPMGRLGKPEEVAEVVSFLCSDEASFITGSGIAIDGGFLAK